MTTPKNDPNWLEARANEWGDRYGHSNYESNFVMMGRVFCRSQSLNPSLPYWQQLAFHAYAMVGKFQASYKPPRGELAAFLGIRSDSVRREVQAAIDNGWLAPGSTRERLILPTDIEFMPNRDRPNTSKDADSVSAISRDRLVCR